MAAIENFYKHPDQSSSPRVGAFHIPKSDHVKLKNIAVLGGDFVFEGEDIKKFNAKGILLYGKGADARKLAEAASEIAMKWISLPEEKKRKGRLF